MSDLVTDYLAVWNETDLAARAELLDRHRAAEVTNTDPMACARGLDQIDATISAVQAQFPGFVFSTAGPVDVHHDQARFSWNLGPADSEPAVVASDVVVTDADGRIATVLGFLDRVPS